MNIARIALPNNERNCGDPFRMRAKSSSPRISPMKTFLITSGKSYLPGVRETAMLIATLFRRGISIEVGNHHRKSIRRVLGVGGIKLVL